MKKRSLRRNLFFTSTFFVILLSFLVSCASNTITEIEIKETLTINSGDLEIDKNDHIELVFSVNLRNAYKLSDINCESSDETVATIVNNKVFGLSSGVVDISCQIGSVVSNSITATIYDRSITENENGDNPEIPSTPITPSTPTTPSDPPKTVTPVTPPAPTTPTPVVPTPPSSQNLLVVSYIDVGQGDSILIQTPNGKTILIDAGTRSYGSKISNYLKARGITKIDVLVATHPHADHIGGMPYVIENFQIGSIYMPKAATTTQTYETLLTAIQNKGLLIDTAKAGITINLDSAIDIKIIAPVSNTYSDLNQYSVVIKIDYNQISFLFMGDAGLASERDILNSGVNLKADVLKVGHHGSSTSSTQQFLDAVSPQYAVICVGENNRYGHPTDTILNRLSSLGINILRTDRDGSIVISSDGNNVFVE